MQTTRQTRQAGEAPSRRGVHRVSWGRVSRASGGRGDGGHDDGTLCLVVGLHELRLCCLELEHFKEIGDHGAGAVQAVEVDLGHPLHDGQTHLAILAHLGSQACAVENEDAGSLLAEGRHIVSEGFDHRGEPERFSSPVDCVGGDVDLPPGLHPQGDFTLKEDV